jgi:ATP-dependent RNA helicase DHX57
VATRVAEERGESKAGIESIGYVVRGDSALCDRSRLVFCTTGVLLRQLQNKNALDCITHIVIDEVHERQLDSDILLGLLKKSMPSYPNLRVILMSATLDKDLFLKYFGEDGIPHVHIPGRTFPVKDNTLEDVLRLTNYIPPKNSKRKKWSNRQHHRKQSPWNDSEKSDHEDDEDDSGGAPQHGDRISVGATKKVLPMEVLLERINESSVDYELISRLVCHIIVNNARSDDGSILIFLAGAPEISSAMEAVRQATNDLPVTLLPLHGGLQPREQSRVFHPADRGSTKIVFATNVAETSVRLMPSPHFCVKLFNASIYKLAPTWLTTYVLYVLGNHPRLYRCNRHLSRKASKLRSNK